MKMLIITPKTKIFDLLEAYPQLEDTLIAAAPPFRKLKNPVLRKTVARITTIGQAATIGGVNVDKLVNVLRKEVGQSELHTLDMGAHHINTERPDWFSPDKVVQTIDINDILKKGEQPVHEVLTAVKKLKDDEVLMIVAPFIPAPLIDKSISLGYNHWMDKKSEEECIVYFRKQ